jgi:hypothetical protein
MMGGLPMLKYELGEKPLRERTMVGLGREIGDTVALAAVFAVSLSNSVLAQQNATADEVDLETMCMGEGLDEEMEPRLPGLVMENFFWQFQRCPYVAVREWSMVDCERELFLQMTVFRDGEEGTLAHRKPIDLEVQMTSLRSSLIAAGNEVDIAEIENAMRAAGAPIKLSQWSGVAGWCDN